MNTQTWIDWCQKQLSDVSARLFRQGYTPARIECLCRTSPEFNRQFQGFLDRLNQIMDQMAENPGGYHHFDEFTGIKRELLHFTNAHREEFLELRPAQAA